MTDTLIIHNRKIELGQQKTIKMNVASLPSGTKIELVINVCRAKEPGPVVLLIGGVHGDEINGVEIVRRFLTSGINKRLLRGTIISIPLLNIYGFINFSRDTPDGKDVNRSFPGASNGSLSSRVARSVTKYILPHADIVLDFHTGGASRYNFPQIRYTKGDEKARELAQIFNTPFVICKPAIPKSLRKVAQTLNKPLLIFEGGESLRYDGFSLKRGVQGIERILIAKEMISGTLEPTKPSIMFTKTHWIRAAQAGLFTWSQQSGAKVSVGEPLGVINDPYGGEEIRIFSNKDGYIIGHNNAPVVSQGDALFHIGIVGA